ncbi:Mitochondrial import inner membrane translocase subunit tim23 [Didymella pomorum]|uniref:Mitochondrial import inner membrane translocase subunit tim23 n=1 Tax=Didymella pomorum TaxID=749634 RepID=A0A9W8Z7Z3_9PLEO|nr:Mitochondrial import inner membrane translocase subunit tim23 [Didymella pomorum]
MGVWDMFTGKKSTAGASQSPQEPHDNFSASPSTPAPVAFDPTTAIQNPSDFILDPSQLHPLAGLNQDTLDYLSLEDSAPVDHSALPSRGWSDDLCYGTGVSYLTALTIGGAWGLSEGLQKNPASMPPRLRLNGVLNAVTRRGPFLGNSAGVIALIYNGTNSTIGALRGKHDPTNSVVAGAISGAIFKSTRGTRPMAISAAVCASVAGTWAITRKVFFEPVPEV